MTKSSGVEESITADQLLVCTGVSSVAPKLNLSATSVQLRGNSGYLFWHSANFEGEYLLEHVIYPLALSRGFITNESVLKSLEANLRSDFETYKSKSLEGGSIDPEDFAQQLSYPPCDYEQGMPWAVFSNPQVAGIGKSEDELIAEGKVLGK